MTQIISASRGITYNVDETSTHSASFAFLIAASDASAEFKAKADYVCDGTNDKTKFALAIAALPTDGGVLELSDGSFTLAETLEIDKNCVIRGQGCESTLIHTASAFTDTELISITQNGRVALRDIGLSDDVSSTPKTLLYSEGEASVADCTLDCASGEAASGVFTAIGTRFYTDSGNAVAGSFSVLGSTIGSASGHAIGTNTGSIAMGNTITDFSGSFTQTTVYLGNIEVSSNDA